jgi:hypothetical protein
MIKITLPPDRLTGRVCSFAGIFSVKGAEEDGSLILGEPVDPVSLFACLVRHDWTWQVDYSDADQAEILAWFRAEMSARMFRALAAGRPIRFLDREFQVREGDDVLAVMKTVEDVIAGSGRLVTIASDDEKGVVIEAVGYE